MQAIILAMNGSIGIGGWVKVLLPLVFAVVFSLSPRPRAFDVLLGAMHEQGARAEVFEKALAYEPWRTDALEKLAEAQAEAGDDKAVIQTLALPGGEDRLSAAGYRLLADAYQKSGQVGLALAASEKVLAREPEKRENFRAVYELQVRLGKYDAALTTLNQWLERFPDDAWATYQRGLIRFAHGEGQALADLRAAAAKDPQYEPSAVLLVAADEVARQSDDDAYRRLARGRALGAVGAWGPAESVLEGLTQAHPEYAEGWAFLGETRQQTGSGDGLMELERAARLDEGSLTVKGLTALYWRRHRQYDKAVALIAQAAAREPANPAWQMEWANTLAEEGELRIALRHFRKAAALDEGERENLYRLAEFSLAYRMDLRETGLPAAREGAAAHPDEVAWVDLLGRIFQALGDVDLAQRSLERAVHMAPDYGPAQLHLGQFYLEQNDAGKAYPYLRSAALQTKDPAVKELAARLLLRFFNETVSPQD